MFVIEPHRFDGFFHPFGDFVLFEPQIFRAERHVFFHRFVEQLIFGILENHADFRAEFFEVGLVVQLDPVDGDFARREFYKPVKVLNESGFSAARRADDSQKIAVFDRERNIVKCLMLERGFGGIYV